jgi:hypothetical protein
MRPGIVAPVIGKVNHRNPEPSIFVLKFANYVLTLFSKPMRRFYNNKITVVVTKTFLGGMT